jgi:type IV secretion system protein VirD4
VSTGSVSKGKNDPSRSLQMMERHLKTADELKALPFGNFILMKTGAHPMETRLNLYFKWGIDLDVPYEAPEQAGRKVEYADRQELMDAILERYPAPEAASETSTAAAPPAAKGKVRV